jgi:cytochrome P450
MPTLFWWLAYMHAKNQQHEFVAETKRLVGDGKLANMNLANVLSSKLLHAGLKETLRIHGHNMAPRKMEEDLVLKIQGKEYHLKKGSMVFAPSSLVNLNPEIYSDPETWQVERFLDNKNQFGGATKYDPDKLKIPLLIWGAGIHAVHFSEGMTNGSVSGT